MSIRAILANYIRTHGPIQTARVSSAQARGAAKKYAYWGAVRYQLQIAADGMPTNVALERASSDRRSQSKADEDCDDLCDREDRIRVQVIGRLSELECLDVVGRLDDAEVAKAIATHQRRQHQPMPQPSLLQRLRCHKAAKVERETKRRINELAAAEITVHGRAGEWFVASKLFPLWTAWSGQVQRAMMSATDPIACSVKVTTVIPPTVAEAEEMLRCESDKKLRHAQVRIGAASLGSRGGANDHFAVV